MSTDRVLFIVGSLLQGATLSALRPEQIATIVSIAKQAVAEIEVQTNAVQ